jgi:RHS repeat-associated protein
VCNVMMADGEVFQEVIDIDLPGVPTFFFKRGYSTKRKGESLGVGWSHNLESCLTIEGNGVRLHDGIDPETCYPVENAGSTDHPRIQFSLSRADVVWKNWAKTYVPSGADDKWLLVQTIDPNGNWTRREYSNTGLTDLTDSAGRKVRLGYLDGLISDIRIQQGHSEIVIQYIHDSAARLTEVIDSLGFKTYYEYDGNYVVRFVNKGGVSKYFAYDQLGRCACSWYEQGLSVRYFQFRSDQLATLVSDSNGECAVYLFTASKQIRRITDFMGRTTEYIMGADSSTTCVILPDGNARQMAFYETERSKRVLTSIDLRGELTRYFFNETGEVIRITNAAGYELHFDRDARGNTTGMRGPEGANWQFEYDERGALAKVVDPKGNYINRTDSSGTVRVADVHGLIGEYFFDQLGNLTADVNADGNRTEYQYEGQDRLVRMVLPDGTANLWTYDAAGRVTSFADGLCRITRFEYGPFGEVCKTIYPDGRQVELVFDQEHNLMRIVNRKREVTEFEYDRCYRLITVVFFDGRTIRYKYDERNRPVIRVDGRDMVTRFEYDKATNVVKRSLPDGTTQTNEFDSLNRLVSMQTVSEPPSQSPPRQSQFKYDGNNYVTVEEHGGFTVEYTYDKCNNLAAARDSLGRVLRYEVNSRRWVTRLYDGHREFNFRYSPGGLLIEIGLPNGMSYRFSYDSRSRMINREVVAKEGFVAAWRRFQYDAADQLIEAVDWRTGYRGYYYDVCGRLISVVGGDGSVIEGYAYDAEDNMTASPVFQNAFVEGNRMLSAGKSEFTYDGDGCLAAAVDTNGEWAFEYDIGTNELIEVRKDGNQVASYRYDLMGRRTEKSRPSEYCRYYYHTNRLRTILSSESGRSDIVYAPDTFVPLSQTWNGQCYYYSFDQLGTPTEMWNERGALVATVGASSFGANRTVRMIEGRPLSVPFHFLGQFVDDETGLFYNRFRYYSPETGRYSTPDPIGLKKGLNLYTYPSNPLNWVDPFGLSPLQINCALQHRNFTPCEQYAAQEKMKSINAASKNRRKRTCTECREDRQKSYFENTCGGSPPKNSQVDHSLELQLGGADYCCGNLMAIPRSVNGSFGSQIKNLISEMDVGDCVPKFEFTPPGCTEADKCTGKDRDDAVVRGTKDDGKDCTKEPALDC